ncbi:hypothetical protein C8J57DRAFT_1235603 [Mycena rebaudengoi]|nr:hypothetical protein C8J57DRAFT_1235603 [Mycena rebaudengoi]
MAPISSSRNCLRKKIGAPNRPAMRRPISTARVRPPGSEYLEVYGSIGAHPHKKLGFSAHPLDPCIRFHLSCQQPLKKYKVVLMWTRKSLGRARKVLGMWSGTGSPSSANHAPGVEQRRIGRHAAPLSADVGCPIQVEINPQPSPGAWLHPICRRVGNATKTPSHQETNVEHISAPRVPE